MNTHLTPKRTLRCREVTQPITEPITKFGGQPVWLEAPQWPISRATGQPMMFICQVQLADVPTLERAEGMAYIFMTDEWDDPGPGMLQTWDPEAGESAVILQGTGARPVVPTEPLTTGPALHRRQNEPGLLERGEDLIECAVDMALGWDRGPFPERTILSWGEDAWSAYWRATNSTKLGGVPNWPQDQQDSTLVGDEWVLILQVIADEPFFLLFGEAGTGYAFLRRDCTEGRFLYRSI